MDVILLFDIFIGLEIVLVCSECSLGVDVGIVLMLFERLFCSLVVLEVRVVNLFCSCVVLLFVVEVFEVIVFVLVVRLEVLVVREVVLLVS